MKHIEADELLSGPKPARADVPDFNRKFINRRQRGNEGHARRACDPEIELSAATLIWKRRNAGREAGGTFLLRPRLRFAWTEKCLRERVGYECAGTGLCLEVSLRVQLLERELHGEPGNSEVGGQRAGRRKPGGIMIKATGDQLVSNLPVELLMKRLARLTIEPKSSRKR